MSDGPVSIKRYPNRRYYAKNTSKYVSLQDIAEMVRAGETVEIRDSQTGDDLTRTVLTQIILELHPEKISLFPTDLLHSIVRSNDVLAGFLRDYFQHSLTYLDYLQRHSAATTAIAQPMHWVKAWLDGISASRTGEAGPTAPASESAPTSEPTPAPESAPLAKRVEQLEERLRQLESQG